MVSLDEKITKESFEDRIQNSEICFVEFGAKWCSYCMRMKPIIEDLARKRRDIEVIEIDIDDSPLLAAQYRIMSLPTFIIFKDGEAVYRRTGILRSDEISDAIEKAEEEN